MYVADTKSRSKAKSPGCGPPGSATKVKMIHYDAAESEEFDRDEVSKLTVKST